MFTTPRTPMCIFMFLCLLASCLLVRVSAQSSGNATSASASISLNVTVVPTTSSVTTTTVSRTGNRNVPITTVIPTVVNATITHTSTISPTASATPTASPIVLATKLDPAFGVLGALLIITGLPSAFWGHKNRWTSFFLIGFYTLSLVCIVLILKFGILAAVNPPNTTLRGLFVLASTIAGIIGGAIAVFFWKAAKYFIGAWGGFAFALFIECFRNGGLIDPVGLRWIMYIAFTVVGFVLCTIPKLHWHVLLVSTAIVGASAFMLGVDCFTTAGLKEFYIWNLGFRAVFPKFVNNGIRFPVSQTMQIELGLMAAVALTGGAVQLRVLVVLRRKLKEIAEEQKKRDEEAEIQATERFAGMSKELEEWERDHPTLSKHGRQESGFESTTPLIKESDPGSPFADDKRSSTLTFGLDGRSRHLSGVSDFMAATPSDDEAKRAAKSPQSPGILPAMDLGLGIQEDVPTSFLNDGAANTDGLARKEALLDEIQAVRRSIDALRSESPTSDSRSRRVSLTSRRTLSYDLGTAVAQSGHPRPPRQADPRARANSMELDRLGQSSELGASIGRPTSVPLRDGNWDSYVQDRKLLQPPSGITAPIPTTPTGGISKIAMPQAVSEALTQRKQRESVLQQGELGQSDSASPALRDSSTSSEDIPVAALAAKTQTKKSRPTSKVPTTILPPRKAGSPIAAPTPVRPNVPRTATYEELAERHRQKMREMQAPLNQAEKEQADLAAAKSRWERSKDIEKSVVTKRQAEQAALYVKEDKKRKSQEDRDRTGKSGHKASDEVDKGRHSRSLSADKLATIGGTVSSSKRLSTLKVEDWQKYQQEQQPDRPAGTTSKRDSRGVRSSVISPIPFPDPSRRKTDRSSGLLRDPPT